MRFLFTILLVSCPLMNTFSSTVGSGEVELGIGRNNEQVNAGIGMRYNMKRLASNHQTYLTTRAQLGGDQGRALIATAAHEFQYQASFIENDLNHVMTFYSPRLSWLSGLSHRLNFNDGLDDEEADNEIISTDYSNTNESWSITTGPEFQYGLGAWFNSLMAAKISRAYAQEYFTDESLLSLDITKSVGHITQLSLSIRNICSTNENPLVDDFCRDEISLGFETGKKDFGYAFDYGYSKDNDVLTDIYSASSYFNLNSTSIMTFSAYRLVDRIGIKDDLENNNYSSVKLGRIANFLYERGRTRIEINGRRVNSDNRINKEIKEDASIFYDFRLSSWACTACRLALSHEYSRFNLALEQNISSVGFNKRNNKNITSEISFRKTERTDQDTLWSINYLISYSGSATVLSDR